MFYDHAPPPGNHSRRDKLTGSAMALNIAPHRHTGRFPERPCPGEVAVLHHALVAAPDIVHQDVIVASLAEDQVERRFHLIIHAMVIADAGDPLTEMLVIQR